MTTRGEINSNFYQIVNVDANGTPTSLTSNIIGNSTFPNANYANYANISNVTNSVTVANVVGIGNIATVNLDGNATHVLYGNGVFAPGGGGNANVANYANYANYANVANTANSVSVGNVIGLGNIATLNLNGNSSQVLYGNGVFAVVSNGAVANFANFAGNVTVASQPNITSVGTLTSLSVTGNVNGANIIGNHYGSGNNLSNIQASNITGTVANANYAAYSGIAASANSVAGANVTGAVAYATVANSVVGSNVSGQVGNALVAGTVYTNAQPNITSVGTLSVLNVTGNISSANYILGNGAFLTGLPNGAYANFANYAGNVTVASQPNITSVGTLTTLSVTGNVTSGNISSGNITANYFIGSGNNLSNIQGSNVTGNVTSAITANFANYAGNVTVNAQPNITSVGTLTSLTVTGNVTSGNISSGNITANYFIGSGNNLSNIQASNITGTIANANYATYSGTAATANSVAGANVTGQVGNALVAGTVYTNAQPNITSVGTLTNLSVTGNITSGNISVTGLESAGNLTVTGNISSGNANLGNAVIANYHIGSGNNLSNIQASNITGIVANANYSAYSGTAAVANSVAGANVSGQVANALVAGTVYTNAQPNITSVGTLTSLSITGNLTSGNANLGNAVVANYHIGSGNNLSNIQASNITGTVANANYSAYAGIAASANSVAGANVTGQVNYAAVANSVQVANVAGIGNIATVNLTGNSAQVLYGNGTFASTGTVANANYSAYAGNVTVNAQPNITSVGTLSNLTVYGNATTSLTTIAVPNNSVTGMIITAIPEGGNNAFGTKQATGLYVSVSGNLANFDLPTLATFQGSGSANIDYNGNITGNYIKGNGYYLTGISFSAPGSNTQIVFNDNGTVNANANLTFNKSNSALTTGYIVANGYYLNSINGGNVYSIVANANYAAYSANAVVATVAGTVTTSAQPNITSVGTLANLTVTGNITSGNLSVTGLESDGNLSVTGNISSGNANLGNLVTSNFFSGSGNLLSNIQAGNVSGTVANANYSAYAGNATIANSANSVAVANVVGIGNIATINLTGSSSNVLYGNGVFAPVSNVAVSANFANYAGNVTVASQPNITSVGTLTSLTVTGNVTSGNVISGNATGNSFIGYDSGNTSVANFAGNVNTYIQMTLYNANTGNVASADFAIYDTSGIQSGNFIDIGVLGNNWNNSSWTINGPSDAYLYTGGTSNLAIGTSSTTNVVFFSGGVLSTNERMRIVSGGNIGINQPNPLYTLDITGNLRLTGNLISGNANLGNLVIANYYQGTLTTNAQPNITSVGTLTSLSVTGNISSGNANLGNAITGNYFIGSGNNLSNIQGSNVSGAVAFASVANSVAGGNVSGQVSNALIAGTVYTNAQPNITSVGTLTSLSVTGNISAGNLTVTGLESDGNLNVTSNITSGNANLGNLAVANYFSGNGSLLTGITASAGFPLASGNSNINAVANGNIFMSVGGVANTIVFANTSINSSVNVSAIVNNGGFFFNAGNITAASGGGTYGGISLGGQANVVIANSTGTRLSYGTSNILISPSANINFTAAGTANILQLTSTGATVSTGTLTTTSNALSITSTWNNATANFNAIQVNTIPTANATGSYMLNLQNNGTNKFTVDVNGIVTASGNINGNNLSVSNVYFTGGSITGSFGSYNAISLNSTSNVILYSGSGLKLTAGSSNINTAINGNISFSANGTANVMTISNTTVTMSNNLSVSNRVTVGGAGYIDSNFTFYSALTPTGGNLNIGSAGSVFIWGNAGNPALTVAGTLVAPSTLGLQHTFNNASQAYTSLLINPTVTANAAGSYLIQAQNSGTNKFTVDVNGNANITNALLKQYNETVIASANTSTSISPDVSTGTIFTYVANANFTFNGLTNAVTGSSAVVKISQPATGGPFTMTSTMKFAGGSKTLSTAANATDIVSVFYDGTTYWATLSTGYA